MLFFTAATTILSSFFLVHQPTTVTGMLSSLFHHLHPNFIVAFPSLPHFHGYLVYPPSPHRHGSVVFSSPPPSRPKNSRNPASAPLTRSQFWPVLVYFVFSFTLIHLKMWYSCGHNGRDRLWKNQPYSVHVWLTIRTRRTQEHVAHEGKKPLTIVNLIYSFL